MGFYLAGLFRSYSLKRQVLGQTPGSRLQDKHAEAHELGSSCFFESFPAMNNKQWAKRKAQKKNAKPSSELAVSGLSHLTTRLLIPDMLTTKVTYFDTAYNNLTRNGFVTATQRFTPSGLYDIDPRVSSGTVAGFNQYKEFYNRYRVIKCAYEIEFCNLEAFPIQVMVVPLNDDPGADDIDVLSWRMNPRSKAEVLSAAGGMDRTCIKGEFDLAAIVGTVAQRTDSIFSAQFTSNPTDNVFLGYGCAAIGGNTLTSNHGFGYVAVLQMEVEFFERKLVL